ncbi:hypothetical protein F0562_017704 [Nyssa sinensis]|uniref:Uncharacterized protein n=1 Tax=Nyssa sinensis TaxID=561372 RepID=A0A5J4ZJL7_9ASTE|nr:hypothetical protein F0562_017704 [Nyssa sinensis]
MVMEAQGLDESIFPSILNTNISNVHGRHDSSALLLESRWDDVSEGVDGDAREDALIHDTYSGHSWADHAKEGKFIPQVALDLEAEFGDFSEDPSFLMESFQYDVSSPSLRGSSNLNNGSHGGCGGGGRGARVACGIQTNKHSIRPALCDKEEMFFEDQHRECPLDVRGGNTLGVKGVPPMGNPLAQGDEVRAVQGSLTTQKVTPPDLMCNSKGLSIQAKIGECLLVMGDISGGAKEERPLDNRVNQGGGVGAVPALLTATKCPFSDLKCTSKGLSSLDTNGGSMWLIRWVNHGAKWSISMFSIKDLLLSMWLIA